MNIINTILCPEMTRSIRIRLFQLYILMLLSETFISTELNCQPDQKVVWEETPHKVVYDYNNYLLLIQVESPCVILPVTTEDEIRGRKKCETAYKRRITSHLESFCSKVDSVEDLTLLSVFENHSKTRVKRVIEPVTFTLAIFAIFGIASTTIALIESTIAIIKVNQLEDWMQKKAAASHQIHIELEKALLDMKKLFSDALDKQGKQTENDLNVQATLRKIEIVEPHLLNFLIDFTNHKVSNDFDFLFSNFEICPNCPKPFMKALNCSIVDNYLALRIRTSKVFDKGLIKKANPFVFLKEESGKQCYSRYIGKKYMFMNTQTGCQSLIDFNPGEYGAYYAFNPNICPFCSNKTQKTYQKDECLDDSEIDFEQIVQHRQDRKFNHVYCVRNKIQINNNKPSTCLNHVYKFPLIDKIKVNNRSVGASYRSEGAKLDLESDKVDPFNNSAIVNDTVLNEDVSNLNHALDVDKHLDDNLFHNEPHFLEFWNWNLSCDAVFHCSTFIAVVVVGVFVVILFLVGLCIWYCIQNKLCKDTIDEL